MAKYDYAPLERTASRVEIIRAANQILRANEQPKRKSQKAAKKQKKIAERLRPAPFQRLTDPPKPAPDNSRGVYVIGAPDQPVKIGITAAIDTRFNTIQTGCPHKLQVYLFLKVPEGLARPVEKDCHARLDCHRLNGEWFDMPWREAVDMVYSVARRFIAAAERKVLSAA